MHPCHCLWNQSSDGQIPEDIQVLFYFKQEFDTRYRLGKQELNLAIINNNLLNKTDGPKVLSKWHLWRSLLNLPLKLQKGAQQLCNRSLQGKLCPSRTAWKCWWKLLCSETTQAEKRKKKIGRLGFIIERCQTQQRPPEHSLWGVTVPTHPFLGAGDPHSNLQLIFNPQGSQLAHLKVSMDPQGRRAQSAQPVPAGVTSATA